MAGCDGATCAGGHRGSGGGSGTGAGEQARGPAGRKVLKGGDRAVDR